MVGRQRQKPRGRNSQPTGLSMLVDTIILRVKTGSSTIIKLSDLNIPSSRPFRILDLRYQATNDTKPLVLNMRFFGPQSTSDAATVSGPFCVSSIPKRGLFVNRTRLFYPPGTSLSTQLFVVDNLCVDKIFTDVAGTVICRLRVQLGPEELSEACPKILLPEPDSPESDTGSFDGAIL